MVREVIKIQVVKAHLEGDDVAYIRLTSFNEQTDSGLRHAYQQLKGQAHDHLRGIVLDLRNNPGGLLDQAVAVSDDFIIARRNRHHARAAPRGQPALGRQGRRHHRRAAGGGADQRRLRLGQRDRRGRAAGPSPRGAGRHPQLRQGQRADRDPAARQRRDAADHGALLHAVRPLHPGPRHRAGRGGAATAASTSPSSGRSARRTSTGRCATPAARRRRRPRRAPTCRRSPRTCRNCRRRTSRPSIPRSRTPTSSYSRRWWCCAPCRPANMPRIDPPAACPGRP